uniref:F-box domain-containing protein n=1 Tax=Astatotilapia calliptera TaxID=8154 RepID=A0AAX7SGC5_ASTCA
MEQIQLLPPEVWVYVLSYLNTEEKHTVRFCCKHLKNLVDHPSLWRDYTVVLSDLRRYTYGFWDTLNYRSLTRVTVRHLGRKEWRRLVKFLPSLSTIVFVDGGRQYKEKYLDALSRFPDLRGVGVRNAIWDEPVLGHNLAVQLGRRLTQLSVCNVRLPNTVQFVNSVSHLVNLRYLLFHQQGEGYGLDTVRPVPCSVFHNLLLNLTKLKHLSWGMKGEPPEPLPDDYFNPADPDQPGGNSLTTYTTTIPPSVTRLTLRVAITLKDMDSIAPKVPGLEHLDIEQNRSSGSLCRRIPMLFPQLKTLRIRFFRREPEKDLLSLHKLRHLVRLELIVERSFILRDYLNGHPWPSPSVQELISELQELSENRITVITTMRQRNPLRECDCVWEGD